MSLILLVAKLSLLGYRLDYFTLGAWCVEMGGGHNGGEKAGTTTLEREGG
jgi:hypothetical protein